MDVDSQASEGLEDFHPSSLLEVLVKEADNPESDRKNESDLTLLSEPSLSAVQPRPVLLHVNQSANFSMSDSTMGQKSVEDKKGGYWRSCFLCQSRCGKDPSVSYHKFPSDEVLCNIWRNICNVTIWEDVNNLRICSKHFRPEDYVDYRAKIWGGIPKLKVGAAPSLFVPNNWVSPTAQQYILVPPGQQLNPVTLFGPQMSAVPNVAPQPSSAITIKKENIMPGFNEVVLGETPVFPSTSEAWTPMQNLNKAHKQASEKKVEPVPYWRTCFLCNFKEPGGKNSTVAFHKFPADVSACKLWKQVCNLTDGDDVSTLKLCSKHFHEEDYIDSRAKQLGGLLKLKPGTVPSVGVPNPLSNEGAPTKYFIVSNADVRIPASNGVQSTQLLNVILRDPATGAVIRTGNTSTSAAVTLSNGRKSAPPPTSIPKVVLSRLPDLGSFKPKKQAAPEVLTVHNASRIGQPRVVMKRLSMSDINKFKQGLLTDVELMEGVKVKKCPNTTKTDGNTRKYKKGHRSRHCFVCNLKEGSDDTVALHKFPSDPDVCKEWKRACDLHEEDNVSNLLVCSRHFKPEDYLEVRAKQLGGRLKVIAGAVPSVDVPNSESEFARTLANMKTESPDEFHPSNLLEVIVNESESSDSFNEDLNTKETGEIQTSRRSCFLCSFKEERGIQSTVTLHKFPKDERVIRLWKQVCNLLEHDYINTSSLFICSNHFVAEDFIHIAKVSGSLPVLKLGAVPSIFVPNPLKVMPLSTLKSIEPESLEELDDINPMDLMEVTFDAPDSPEQNFNETSAPEAVNYSPSSSINSNNGNGSFQFPNLKTLGSSQEGVSRPKQFLAVTKTYSKLNKSMNVLIRDLNPHQKSCVSKKGAAKGQTSNTGFPKTIQKTVDKIASTKPVFLGNPLNLNQTFQFIQARTLPTQNIQLMPPLKLSMAPPGLFLHSQPLKKAAKVVDNSSQTLSQVQCMEQSCQTDAVDENEDFADEDMELDSASPPVPKKRRMSLPLIETTSSETSGLKQIGKGAVLNIFSHSYVLEDQMRRIKKRINTLDDLICHLQKRDLLSKDAADVLVTMVPDVWQETFVQKLRMRGISKWCPELKSFALTLHLYSIDAYKYVRNLWPNLVPEVSHIKNWFTVGNAMPGFTQEVLDAIYLQGTDKKEGILCNVVISEMPIRQQTLFENNRFYGGVDLGTNHGTENDSLFEAQNLLIFFVTALDTSWSVPIGYFLIRSLNAKERANLLVKCFDLLHKASVNVLSITLDGSPMNTSMCCHLGANFSYDGEQFQPWFLNPVTREKVFVFWDPCSMMKLVRDALGDRGTLIDSESKYIKWSYIKELSRVQSKQPWEVDTKLTEMHAGYQGNRTDIKLCLQTLSRSVYKGFMSVLEKNMESFEGCYSTAVFCLMFNNIFDMLNCRNGFFKKKYRVPINDESIASLRHSASVFIKYITSLKDNSGTPVLNSCRKTGFVGLITCLTNIFELYDAGKLLGLKHLLTHKLSLDNVRAFFSTIQCRVGGDPNAKEFESMYRNLILKHGTKFEKIDCLVDAIDVLGTASQVEHYMEPICDYKNQTCAELTDHNTFRAVLLLKPIIGDTIKYMSGFVVNKILSKKFCIVCAQHLTNLQNTGVLLKKENQGEYIVPSEDVCRICRCAEMVLREYRSAVYQSSNVKFLTIKTLCRVGKFVFDTEKMKAHVLEQGIFDNHVTQLCNLVTETFLSMRMSQNNVEF